MPQQTTAENREALEAERAELEKHLKDVGLGPTRFNRLLQLEAILGKRA
jgi:hypothetical protein